jgi:hypothetical protein
LPAASWTRQTADPGYPGSYDGTVGIACNAAENALGIASYEWGSGWDDFNRPSFLAGGTGLEVTMFASTNCAFGQTQTWPYGYNVTLNDGTVFTGWFYRSACYPVQ